MIFTDMEITAMLLTLIAMVLDVITGLVAAAYEHKISSSEMRKGFFRKSAIGLMIIIFGFAEVAVKNVSGLDFNGMTVDVACTFVIFMEVVSCLENIKIINPDLAKFLDLFGGKHEKN